MPDSKSSSTKAPRHHNRWLILIAVFKITQALLFIALGVGVLRLLHKDVGDMVTQFVEHMRHFNPESHFVNLILVKASIVDDKMLRRISWVVFSYAAVCGIEGIGLYLEKTWAEYFTLIITASFLPWELFEIIRKLTWIRGGLLVVNVLVFIYLLKIVTERGKNRRNGPQKSS